MPIGVLTISGMDSTRPTIPKRDLILKMMECRKDQVDFHTYDAADCSARCASAILKTFGIRPIGLLPHVFAGSKVMLFHAGMKCMIFCPVAP